MMKIKTIGVEAGWWWSKPVFNEKVTFDGSKEAMREFTIRYFDNKTGKTKEITIKGTNLVEINLFRSKN